LSKHEYRPIVLNSEGLSRAIRRDTYIRGVIETARNDRSPVVISAASIVEVVHPRINRAALAWTRSRLDVIPVSEVIANRAAELLIAADMHGHKHAIDAIVCATALELGGHPTIFTSDPSDIQRLVEKRASVVPLR